DEGDVLALSNVCAHVNRQRTDAPRHFGDNLDLWHFRSPGPFDAQVLANGCRCRLPEVACSAREFYSARGNLTPSFRAKRSNPEAAKQDWIASAQALLAMTSGYNEARSMRMNWKPELDDLARREAFARE